MNVFSAKVKGACIIFLRLNVNAFDNDNLVSVSLSFLDLTFCVDAPLSIVPSCIRMTVSPLLISDSSWVTKTINRVLARLRRIFINSCAALGSSALVGHQQK